MSMNKIAVIGGGISGVSVANLLHEKTEVKVFDKNDRPGGLVRCERVEDNLYHKVGGHVFNSKNQEVLDWFWKHFDREKEFNKTQRNAKILFEGRYIGYPIENYLYQMPEAYIDKIIDDLMAITRDGTKDPMEYGNFKDFLQANFGKTLYDSYFGPYNNKIWKTDLSNVSLEWLQGKLPMPNIKEVLKSNILQQEETGMVHAFFYYPKENGSQFVIDRLAEGLDVVNDQFITSIKHVDNRWEVNGETFDQIVYCGDIRKLYDMVQVEDKPTIEALKAVTQLKSNGTSNLFCETDDNDISWLYLPNPELKAHRIIYTGNFAESNNRGSGRKTCTVEFSGRYTEEEMKAELKHLPGHLTPLASNYEANSYVIQEQDTGERVDNVKNKLVPLGFQLLGRFAEWEYYNMDKAIEAAMEVKNKLVK